MSHALVLACDLSDDGLALGPRTIMRLSRAVDHAKRTGDCLVVSAAISPNHPNQPDTMAKMMARWLCDHEITDVLVLQAKTFDTRGELSEFMKLDNAQVIISAPWHLRRIKLIVWQVLGGAIMRSLRYVSVPEDRMLLKEVLLLEPLKIGLELCKLMITIIKRT